MDNLHYHSFFPDLLSEGHCVMVNLPQHESILEYINTKIPQECVYEEEGKHYGKEKKPHITVMYGIEPMAEEKAKKILSHIPKRISATLGKISKFENADTPYDVLKIEVHSPHLTKIHETLKRTCENKYEWPNYNPHVTLAYVKKGTCNEMVGDNTFEGKKFTFECFEYSNGVRQENHPVQMQEYFVGQSAGYGGGAMAGGGVAPMNWAGTPSSPQTSRRLKDYPAMRRYAYVQGNTVIGSSLYDTITKDDLNDPRFSPDEIFAGLRSEMRRMEYPDKDVARPIVIRNLEKNPKYYSDLDKYLKSDK
jgi:2'-5' RNA ligase